jgi:RHS repeat-associated protein
LGHTTSNAYDAVNRNTVITKAVGTSVQQTTQTGYDKVGNVTTQTDALNHTTTFAYDNLNRQTAVTDALNHTTTSAYDKVGNRTTVTDALNKVTSYAFDARNRQVAMIDPLGHITSSILDADGNSIASIDPLGNFSVAIYDMLERSAGGVDMLGALTQTQKDAVGNNAAVIDPVLNQTAYVYDALNREVLRTDPTGALTTTAYDADGRVTSIIDRDNRQTTFAYDAANRVIGETWKSSPGGSTVNTQTFTYDAKNQLLTASDTVGTVTDAYDELDRLRSQTDVFGQTLTYSYDAANRQTQMQDSKGGILTSVYDNADRLTSRQLSVAAGTVRVDPGYSNRNELTSLTRYSDVGGSTVVGDTVYGYDDHSRVTAITHKNGSSTTLSYYNYNFDNADRVTQEMYQSTVGTVVYSGTHTYSYDGTNQLKTADSTAYAYDANGNRNTAGYQTSADNRLSNDGVYTYAYDAEGNLSGKSKIGGNEVWSYGYDQRNLLTSVTESGSATFRATYAYDVLGRRVIEDRTDNNGVHTTTHFAFAGSQVWAEMDSTNTTVLGRYVYGDGGETQVLVRIDATAGVQWLLADRLGSIRDVADATQVEDHVEFQAFGAIASETNSANGVNRLYAGLFADRYVNVAFADNRVLDLRTAQWLEEDPKMFGAGDANLRRYVRNDPTNATDPSGLDIWYLMDEYAFLGASHAAVIIGPVDFNDFLWRINHPGVGRISDKMGRNILAPRGRKGFLYVSFGAGKNLRSNDDNLDWMWYNDILSARIDPYLQDYDKYLRFTTKQKASEQAIDYVFENWLDVDYRLIRQNCADLAEGVMVHAGLRFKHMLRPIDAYKANVEIADEVGDWRIGGARKRYLPWQYFPAPWRPRNEWRGLIIGDPDIMDKLDPRIPPPPSQKEGRK